MATSSIGQIVKLDDKTAKIFFEAMKKPQKPVTQAGKRMVWVSDFSAFKNVKQ